MADKVDIILPQGGRSKRESNLELMRIFCMLCIVAHHYVMHSGLADLVADHSLLVGQDYFVLLFGFGGKIGINCFVLITGYYMCNSQITLRKWLRLLGEVEFYNIAIYLIFVIVGYETISIRAAVRVVFPFQYTFSGCYLMFYGLFPFLNKLLNAMNEREHLILIGLSLLIYSVLPSFLLIDIVPTYVTWFCIVYILAAYLRMHTKTWFDNTGLWILLASVSLVLSLASVVALATLGRMYHIEQFTRGYNLVSEANKTLAIVTAVCIFMAFKNLRIPYSRVINTVAASTFGVLLIHDNGMQMRHWLWYDVCNSLGQYGKWYLPFHAFFSVFLVFLVCSLVDIARRYVWNAIVSSRHKCL